MTEQKPKYISKQKVGWHITKNNTLRDGRTVVPGETLSYLRYIPSNGWQPPTKDNRPSLCYHGMHASPTILDAWTYWIILHYNISIKEACLHKVLVNSVTNEAPAFWGIYIDFNGAKFVGRTRKCVWTVPLHILTDLREHQNIKATFTPKKAKIFQKEVEKIIKAFREEKENVSL